jgi:hypothetical protein
MKIIDMVFKPIIMIKYDKSQFSLWELVVELEDPNENCPTLLITI